MANDREIGDLVARFRLIVDETGTKRASAELDNLERKLDRASGPAGGLTDRMGGLQNVMQNATIAALAVGAGVAAATAAFLEAGRAGDLAGEDLARFIELDAELAEFGDTVRESAISIASDLAPALTDLLELLEDVIPVGVKITRVLLDPLIRASDALSTLTGSGDEAVDTTRELARETERAAKAAKEHQKALEQQDSALRKHIDAQIDALEADLRVQGSLFALEDAQASAKTAQEDYNDAVNRTGEFAEREADALEAVEDAQRRLNDARFDARRAADDLAEAEEELLVAQIEFGPQSYAAGEAADAVEEAQHRLDSANADVSESSEDVAEKQAEYQKALEDGGPASEAARVAAEKLERAQLAVKDAALAALEAEVRAGEAIATAGGHTQTAADHTALLTEKLRELSRLVADDPFLSGMLLGAQSTLDRAANPQNYSQVDPLYGTDLATGRPIGAATASSSSTSTTTVEVVNNFGPLDAQAAIREINAELDWVRRQMAGG